MSQNLKAFLMEDVHMTPNEVLRHLAKHAEGRSIGERYVISASFNERENQLELELDDNSRFSFQCRKVA